MSKGFRKLFGQLKEWWHYPAINWGDTLVPNEGGMSPFQMECEKRIALCLAERNLYLSNRTVRQTDDGSMITADIDSLGAQLWIYVDQTDIKTDRKSLCLEWQDYDTPEDHYQAVVSFLRNCPIIENQQ